MSEKETLKPDQAKILGELEHLIGRAISYADEIKWDTVGVQVEGDNVIGLGLYKSGLTTLPESFGNLESLRYLYLSGNQLTALPESFSTLKSLKALNLSDNKLAALLESFGQLKSLQTLELWRNQLMILPESFGNLKSLKELFLYNNRLTALPESFGQLKSLRKLFLWSDKLTTLPESFGNLKSLKELNLSDNQLITLPESFGKLKSLQILSLRDNQLKVLPVSFGDLKSLQKLYLSDNKLTTLPKSFGQLNSLQTLELYRNKLTALPETFGQLESLQELDLDNNQLMALLESFGQLESLQKLDLQNNQLTALPESFYHLKNLKELKLKGNHWKGEWKEIISREIPIVLSMCRKLNGINIFISHAWEDRNTYRVIDIKENLEGRDLIHEVHICEELAGNIQTFMDENIPRSQVLVFIGTNNSKDSVDCRYELLLAREYNVKIVLIKGSDTTWEALSQIELPGAGQGSLDLNKLDRFEVKKGQLNTLCDELYQYIVKHEVYTELKKIKKTQEKLTNLLLRYKKIVIDFIDSREFRENFEKNFEKFNKILQEKSNEKITDLEYFNKWEQILHQKE